MSAKKSRMQFSQYGRHRRKAYFFRASIPRSGGRVKAVCIFPFNLVLCLCLTEPKQSTRVIAGVKLGQLDLFDETSIVMHPAEFHKFQCGKVLTDRFGDMHPVGVETDAGPAHGQSKIEVAA